MCTCSVPVSALYESSFTLVALSSSMCVCVSVYMCVHSLFLLFCDYYRLLLLGTLAILLLALLVRLTEAYSCYTPVLQFA